MQLAVWGDSDSDLVRKRVLIVAERIGGQVLGASDGEALVGFVMALPVTAMAAVSALAHAGRAAEYRNAGLGGRLKLAQRDDALARGLS